MSNWEASLAGYEGLILVNAHCDSRVLHEPGFCEYCDRFPQAQAKRVELGVNFTGGQNDMLKPCPAEADRGMMSINGWHGNQPHGDGVPQDYKEALDKIERPSSKMFYGSWDELD